MEKLKIGISQGRLIKPPNNELQWFPGIKWKEEFQIANQIGLNHIELLAEVLGQTILLFLGIFFIHRLITFIPTYSGRSYGSLNIFNLHVV